MSRPPRIRAGLPRWLEVIVAASGLVVASPVLAMAGLAVLLSSPGPALFRQQRMGVGGRPFTLLKFRSMRASKGSQVTVAGDRRVTSVGRVLRATKLDELPELWNILRGEMSFVGPRPEVASFVDLGDERWRRILAARPGLTDPVTLRLRNEEALLVQLQELEPAADTEKLYREYLQPWKIKGYLDYLDRRSPLSDVKILWATLVAVLAPGSAEPPSLDELRSARSPG